MDCGTGVRFPIGAENFNQSVVPDTVSSAVKQPGRVAKHSHPFKADVETWGSARTFDVM